MKPSRSVRLAVAVVLGIAGAVAMWLHTAGIGPHLDIQPERLARTEEFEFWQVTFRVRGGEPIDEIRLEPGTGDVKLPEEGARVVRGLKAGWGSAFRLQVNDRKAGPASVRIVQAGRVPWTYDVALEETP